MATPKISRSKPVSRPRRNVAFTHDWQGKQDDELVILFAGATDDMLVRVFTYLCAGGKGIASDFIIEEQEAPVWRNGFVHDRLAVRIIGYRSTYASIDDLMLLVESRLRLDVNGGYVDRYAIQDFVNLRGRRESALLNPVPTGETPLTRDEVTERIVQEYPTTPTRLLAEKYGRSIEAVKKLAQRKGLKKDPHLII